MECSQNGGTDSILVEQIHQNACHEKDDVDYEPDEIPQTEISLNISDEASMSIRGLDTSPLSFQVKRKPVDELSSSTKKTLIAKYQKVKKQLKKKCAEAAAPGQVDEFKSSWK